ncbi:MAG: acyl-CoA dehydrogenase [Planctomycetales bacterium]|nr:acyl-CoA dehydrogenase [Planctomycetales bacterium]
MSLLGVVLLVLGSAIAGFALVGLVPPLRRALVTRPLMRLLRSRMPTVSETERQALEAGTVWWDAELFSGRPRWDRLLGVARPPLSAEEKAFLDGPVEELCRATDEWRIHREQDLPEEVWDRLRSSGVFGLTIAREDGGLAFSATARSEVIAKLASRSVPLAVTAILPNSLGPAELLHRYGTPEQKKRWLPSLARAEEIPCFALTGPEAGSDAASLPDTGALEKAPDGSLRIRLNFEKRYCTLAPVATVIGLAFRLRDPDRLLGGEVDRGITVALVPADAPGVTIGERHDPLGVAFQNGPIVGRDVVVPLDAVIGGREGVGHGWRMLMECLAAGRGLGLPSMGAGQARAAARVVGAYARVRRQFGLPIGRFEGIEEPLARIAGAAYLMDATRSLVAAVADGGERPAVVSAIVKWHATELGRQVANDAMDILGGAGICRGPRNLLSLGYQAAPIAITVEGANILTRSLIIFGQGAVRAHPFVYRELRALADPDRARGLRDLDAALAAHVRFSARNAVRALAHGLTRGVFAGSPVKGPTAGLFRGVARASAAFALVADASLVLLGASLKRRETLSGRFADALGWMALASAALWRFEADGRPAAHLPLVRWAATLGIHRALHALDAVLREIPVRPAAWLLRALAFPTGVGAPPPSDRLGSEVARILLEPGEARDRLTAGVFVPDDPADPGAVLEGALRAAVAAEPAEALLRAARREGRLPDLRGEELVREAVARGVLSEPQAAAIRSADAARREAIRVDSFPPEELAEATAPPPRRRPPRKSRRGAAR